MGNTVSVMTTVKSVIFSPEDFTLYVSKKNTSPVGIGDFIEINKDTFLKDLTPNCVKNPNKYPPGF